MACLALFLWQGAQAGSLAVNPIRLDLSTASPTAALSLHNRGSKPMLLQLELVGWAMENGQDRYAPTEDILATPPIFTIEPGQSQIVRVGMRRPVRGSHEGTYRLFLEEPPHQIETSSEQVPGLRVALRIGIPVYVAPTVPAQLDLKWRAVRTDDESIRLEAFNAGNIHARLMDIKLATPDGEQEWAVHEGAAYLLPGHTRHWIVGHVATLRDGRLNLRARTEDGAVEIDLEPDSL